MAEVLLLITRKNEESKLPFEVRDLRESDIPTYLSMMRDLAAHTGNEADVIASEEALRQKFFEDPMIFGRVLEVDDEIVGFTTWWVTFATWFASQGMWMCEIYVRPEHRKQGYGTALFDDLKEICRQRDFHGIGWWMEDGNAEATAFYERIGAKRRDERKLYGVLVE